MIDALHRQIDQYEHDARERTRPAARPPGCRCGRIAVAVHLREPGNAGRRPWRTSCSICSVPRAQRRARPRVSCREPPVDLSATTFQSYRSTGEPVLPSADIDSEEHSGYDNLFARFPRSRGWTRTARPDPHSARAGRAADGPGAADYRHQGVPPAGEDQPVGAGFARLSGRDPHALRAFAGRLSAGAAVSASNWRTTSGSSRPFARPTPRLFIAAALLHDLGHWPFCHPIEDIRLPGVPEHELFANSFLLEGRNRRRAADGLEISTRATS